jgi:hypothetical protein
MEQEEWARNSAYPHYTLRDWAEAVHNTALDKGWWTEERTIGDQIALMHSELSEALEEYRNGHNVKDVYFVTDKDGHQKPEGVAVELIDCIIRICDTLARYGVNPQHIIALKAEYNTKRPYRHGGKAL